MAWLRSRQTRFGSKTALELATTEQGADSSGMPSCRSTRGISPDFRLQTVATATGELLQEPDRPESRREWVFRADRRAI
ncbi:antitoxin Xre/MbcA/ParS toxin-binding domain-containing protein [Burkholderia gladioli]|uniref:antitoxin Xre/MbcA/ParS toxin-binding domain-containing protein n=1 Tax=Burkholderia gladioli TaxID=28095 RepID=UPI001FC828A3|nr:antitoxin Xre/MbcA/ParS toxin-binding domain-containing protein [Burkholderia gladioli]